jgi:asparagine synthase (glutamine-hydrolysing)
MCGIAGFLGGGFRAERSREELAAMAAALRHRGPDDEGFWVDEAAAVALCHRRLAIIDLSPLGAQPMRSASGRFTVTFNGEIYNFRELRAELAALGRRFRGCSDTEVLLEAIEEWGLVRALERARGMFALGLWDAAEQALWLARDRFGEKPLHYGQLGGTLVFASELKALRAHSLWRGEVDRDALALLLRHLFIPAPRSVYRGIHKVMPGCALKVRRSGGGFQIEEMRYWEPTAIGASAPPQAAEERELIDQVGEALASAVRLQMVADVPVGAFLSGGIDSSLIVAEMQRASSQPVRTFSIGFEDPEFDETPHARKVAEWLGTRHTELRVTARDALDVIPRLPSIYDEPFADASQIPTTLVCALARRDVTVALSGDAGDELFGGYPRYREAADRWRRLQRPADAWRRGAARAIVDLPTGMLAPLSPAFRMISRGRVRSAHRLQERARIWTADSFPQLYEAMTSFWQPESGVLIGASSARADRQSAFTGADPLAHMMYVDTRGYLTDDILVKVDRAAMAASLETRVPLLDVAVAHAAWSIPTALHTRDGSGKWVLRQLLERHVPRALFERPKRGFAIPLASWLRTELRDWAEALLDPARLRREGYFAAPVVDRRWRQHLSGQADWSSHLWAVLMFQSWLEETSGRSRPPTPSALHRHAEPAVPARRAGSRGTR